MNLIPPWTTLFPINLKDHFLFLSCFCCDIIYEQFLLHSRNLTDMMVLWLSQWFMLLIMISHSSPQAHQTRNKVSNYFLYLYDWGSIATIINTLFVCDYCPIVQVTSGLISDHELLFVNSLLVRDLRNNQSVKITWMMNNDCRSNHQSIKQTIIFSIISDWEFREIHF